MRATPRTLDAGTERNATMLHENTILYADECKGSSSRSRAGNRPCGNEWCSRRKWRGRGERALRYAAAGVAVVAADTDPLHCRGCVQRNSRAGTDAALRSAGLAACGGRVRFGEAVHLGVLASYHYSHCMVAPESRHAVDDHRWRR